MSAPEMYDYQTAAEMLGISKMTLRRWVSEKKIGHKKIGKYTRFEDLAPDSYREAFGE